MFTPFEFSYQEEQERLYFRVWDRRSFVSAHQDAYSSGTLKNLKAKAKSFSDTQNSLFLEFFKAERLADDAPTEGFWFEELLRYGVLGNVLHNRISEEDAQKKLQWMQSWGYVKGDTNYGQPFRVNVPELLVWGKGSGDAKFITNAQKFALGVLVPVESLYVASLFGLLAVEIFTTTAMRMNEAMQICISNDCFIRLVVLFGKG